MPERQVRPRVRREPGERRGGALLPVEAERLERDDDAPVRVAAHVARVEHGAAAVAEVVELLAVAGDLGRGEDLVDVGQQRVRAFARVGPPAPCTCGQAEATGDAHAAHELEQLVLLPEVGVVVCRGVRPDAVEVVARRPAVVPLCVQQVRLVVVAAHVHDLEHVVALERERRERVAPVRQHAQLALAVLELRLRLEVGGVHVDDAPEHVRLPEARAESHLRAVVDRLQPRVEAEDVDLRRKAAALPSRSAAAASRASPAGRAGAPCTSPGALRRAARGSPARRGRRPGRSRRRPRCPQPSCAAAATCAVASSSARTAPAATRNEAPAQAASSRGLDIVSLPFRSPQAPPGRLLRGGGSIQ